MSQSELSAMSAVERPKTRTVPVSGRLAPVIRLTNTSAAG